MQEIVRDIKYHVSAVKANLYAAMELRGSFLLLIIGMMANNAAFILIWMMFFVAFGTVNGWSAPDVLLLQGYIGIVFGLGQFAWGGIFELPTLVHRGELDRLLVSPRSLYAMIASKKSSVSAFGDAIFGLIIGVIFIIISGSTWLEVVYMVLLIVPTTAIFVNVAYCYAMISFYIQDAAVVFKSLFDIFFGPSFYPSGLFEGPLRLLFFFVIPSLAIGGVPVEIVRDSDMQTFGILCLLAFFWWGLATILLGHARKRYVGASA